MRASTNLDDDAGENKAFLQGKDLSNSDQVGRPPVAKGLDDRKDDLVFMQLDCDYYSKSKKILNFCL